MPHYVVVMLLYIVVCMQVLTAGEQRPTLARLSTGSYEKSSNHGQNWCNIFDQDSKKALRKKQTWYTVDFRSTVS